jgi:F-type H+-transporting ATPase subunit delta
LNPRNAAAARRYAKALLDVALTQGDPATVKAALDRLAALVRDNAELRLVFQHPAIPAEKKRAIARALGADEDSPLVGRLLDVLLDRQRGDLLADLAPAFTRAWNAQRGVVEAEVVGAMPLEEAQRQALQAAAEKATGRAVELRSAVDPGLVGGLLLRMEGRVYDGTVRARLGALRERLAGGRSGS